MKLFFFIFLTAVGVRLMFLNSCSPDGGTTISLGPIGIIGLIIMSFGLFKIVRNQKIKKFLEEWF